MKKKMSRTQKSLLYALIGSNLFWHTPMTAYAAETGTVAEQTAEEQHEFSLEGVEVTADRKQTDALPSAYAGGQVAKGAKLGLLGNIPIMDAPFSITSYTAQTIEDQQAQTVSDVLANDSSVRFSTSGGHIMENYRLRGFQITSQDLGFNGMYGLVPSGQTPVEFIERVEVLRGPSTLLTGMSPISGVGGSINLIPKRAGEQPLTRITTDYTSDSQFGTHLDISRRFGQNSKWGVRFNGVYRDGKTGVEGQSKERSLGALGLDYRGERLRASVDAYATKEDSTGGSPMMVSFANTVTSLPKAPDSNTNIFSGIFGNLDNKGAVVHGEYDINDNLTAYAGLGTLHYKYIGFVNSTHALSVDALGNFSGKTTFLRGYSDTVSTEAGLRSRFKTGAVNHQLVLSTTSLQIENGQISKASAGYTNNLYNPSTPILATDPGSAPKTGDSTFSSIALVDTLSFNQDKVLLTLGAREQTIRAKTWNTTGLQTANYRKKAVTPVVAFTVKPWSAPVSLYANYSEGLNTLRTVTDTGALNFGQVFAPFKNKQMEAGVKWDAGNYANTLSLFQITQQSMIKENNTSNNTYTYNADGKQRNRGLEWNIFGTAAKNLRVLGGVSYTRGVLTHTANGTYDGNTAWGTPKWQTNLGFEWDTPGIPGLTLTTRAVYTSSQYANSANTQEMPSWIRYDLGARYTTKVNGQPIVFRASVENLFDKSYWSGSFADSYLTVSSGRLFKLSATIDI